jgi:hypothetical protein
MSKPRTTGLTRRIGRIAAAAGVAAAALTGMVSGTAFAADVPPDRVIELSDGKGNVLEDSFGTLGMGFRNGSETEKWIQDYRTIGGATMVLKNKSTGRCLFVEDARQVGSKVTLGACNLTNQSHNQWRILPGPNGSEMYKPLFAKTPGNSPVLTTFSASKFSIQNVGGGTQQFFPKVVG